MTTDRLVMRFCAQRRRGKGADERGAIAELMRNMAVRIELGRMRHRSRTFTFTSNLDGETISEPVERAFVVATFLDSPARQHLLRAMEECGFAYLGDGRHSLGNWVPLDVGDGFVPIGFFAQRHRSPQEDHDLTMDLKLLMKFLAIRTDLVVAMLAGRRGWHVTTYHRSARVAEEFKQVMERQAPGFLEFD